VEWKGGAVDPFERRVERALGDLPEPSRDVSGRARRAALGALTVGGTGGPRRLTLLVAAALAVGLAGGGALAAIGGALRSEEGSARDRHENGPMTSPGVGHVLTPRPGRGFSAHVGGHLWMATRGGATVEHLPVSAGTLSPNARYVAVGLGSSLVVMKPGGERSWSQAVSGTVLSLSWRPNPQPTEIAYVARVGRRYDLRVIEADGDGDRLVAAGIAGVAPSWRPDGLGLAYVDVAGHPRVYDASVGRVVTPRLSPCIGGRRVSGVSYAGTGGVDASLLLVAARRVVVARPGVSCRYTQLRESPRSIAWIGTSRAVVVGMAGDEGVLRYLRIGTGISPGRVERYPGTVFLGVISGPSSREIAVAAAVPLPTGPRFEVWVMDTPDVDRVTRGPRSVALIAEGAVARAARRSPVPVEMVWR